MGKFKLKYWHSVSDLMANSEKYPSVSLSDEKQGYGLSCEVHPDGRIILSTSSGGGHGDCRGHDDGRNYNEWINLIKEAREVITYYWNQERGLC